MTEGAGAGLIFIPEGVHPTMFGSMLPQILGMNLREKAHRFWHETVEDESLSTTERTIRYAQIQFLIDYADEIDDTSTSVSDQLLIHIGWKFPTTPEEPRGTD